MALGARNAPIFAFLALFSLKVQLVARPAYFAFGWVLTMLAASWALMALPFVKHEGLLALEAH